MKSGVACCEQCACRCQSLPEGSGKPLANLRAWGAELFNSLRTGWSDQPKQKAPQGLPKQAPPQQGSEGSSRDPAVLESSSAPTAAAAEQLLEVPDEESEHVLHTDMTSSESEGQIEEQDPPEEGTWEHWEEVCTPAKLPPACDYQWWPMPNPSLTVS